MVHVRPRLLVLSLAATTLAAPAAFAHHRQTPPIVALTTSGDTALPRLPAAGRTTITLAMPQGADTAILSVKPYKTPLLVTPLATDGDNQNPAISFTGNVVAYDTDADPAGTGLPGRQIVLASSQAVVAGPTDPTGTSVNPALDVSGQRLAFESTGDLANTGNPGARQVFLRQATGGISQASFGVGTSGNPALAARRGWIAFESTSAAGTGVDTGVTQIWLGTVDGVPVAPITNGLAPSTRPSFSDDGNILAFESRANLAGDLSDMGVPQIFIYDTKSKTQAQLTFDPTGCTDAGVSKVRRDWRVGFVCSGQALFYMIRQDVLYRVDTPSGGTTRFFPELGKHFVVMSTTSDMLAGTGSTPGHQIYMVNLYKRPATPVPAPVAVWFPFRGIKPLT
jgi:Tol biopolymer transport system component